MLRLGLIGKNGAGKSAVCAYLVSKGFEAISLSDIVRAEAQKAGLELTRDNLIATGNRLKKDYGNTYLAIESLKKAHNKTVVFDSIRNAEEAHYLQSQEVFLIGIDAPIKLRYERILERGHATDHTDFETFQKLEELESTGQSSGQNINAAFKLCKTTLNNNKEISDLYKQIDIILNKVSANNA